MDEGAVRRHAEQVLELMKKGDLTAAFENLTDEASQQLEPFVLNFPSPVEEARIVSLALEPEGYRAVFDISGGGRQVKLQATWGEVRGRPVIVTVQPVP